MAPSVDGRRFVAQADVAGGEVGTETVFAYHERDGVVWADYAGGSVRRGHLVGTREGDRLEFRYVQLNVEGQTSSGRCVSIVSTLPDGRLRLDETWQWESRPGSGTSAVVEVGGGAPTDRSTNVRELRLVITAENYEEALRFYRDVLGLDEVADFSSPEGNVKLLAAGRATVEVVDRRQAEFIDRVEVGHRAAGHLRIAFEVADTATATAALADAGATVVAEPTRTPWNSLNARLRAPDGAQLTLFEELDPDTA